MHKDLSDAFDALLDALDAKARRPLSLRELVAALRALAADARKLPDSPPPA
jgi:hypothetical protein